ncbi:aldehyde dehydrogenase family protein [Corynebacterium sp. zg254]|uniref:Aldehyde dehydrogenase n=1 Tax=Corynebacterium zhongnanshanii TaxID=2768834 RepID=A0ABQ6VC17_9CORY|nr:MULTISPECIES: aldehyde dehydrogenase family protein [Corynebacterium]KAB3519189.1 aldehyde dehydrogenase family protein [Corynebacterium zhongnanshanii]MCR5915041.1 aldehyde dehydrogenase family protein [Corynebacterium sp. zg254]
MNDTVRTPHEQSENLEGVVARARVAQKSIRALSVEERLEHLASLRAVILKRREEILNRVQDDTHKSRSEILMSEMFGGLDNVKWVEDNAAKALKPHKVPTPLTLMGKKSEIWYEPKGVAFIISPWNYPFFQAIVPIAAAFAAGNAIVYKGSEHTPLQGLIESLLEDAGFAPNWVQVVYGDGSVGEAVIDQKPDYIMFTGSTRTGKKIMAQAAQHLIPVELELGGKDPMIVFEDVNIARTVSGLLFGGLTATGQSCTSVERLYVHESIHDRFVDELVRQVKLLKQEDSHSKDNDLGAMIVPMQIDIVREHLEDALERGATLLTGQDWDRTSALIPPMVLTNVPDDCLAATEETFGPTIPVFSFSDEQEVIERANNSAYGLTASVWSADEERARRVASALHVGGISINNVMATESTAELPFGGVNNSGFGRHKGVEGLHGWCNVKSVIVDKDGDKLEANWYPLTEAKYKKFTQMMVARFADSPAAVSLAKFGVLGTQLESLSQKATRAQKR